MGILTRSEETLIVLKFISVVFLFWQSGWRIAGQIIVIVGSIFSYDFFDISEVSSEWVWAGWLDRLNLYGWGSGALSDVLYCGLMLSD
jgi:hypothetical protein